MNGSEWFARDQRLLGFAALGAVVIASSIANILMKLGARVQDPEHLLFGMVAWQTLLGIASFGCGAIFYAWALKFIDIHVAQSVIAVQYIVVILLAVLILGERVTGTAMVGHGIHRSRPVSVLALNVMPRVFGSRSVLAAWVNCPNLRVSQWGRE